MRRRAPLVRVLLRALPRGRLAAGAAVAFGVAWLLSVKLGGAGAVVGLKYAALALCLAVATILDDPAGRTVAAAPLTLLRRRAVTIGLVAPALAVAWSGVVLVAPTADDIAPGLTLVLVALVLLTLALAVALARGGAVAGPSWSSRSSPPTGLRRGGSCNRTSVTGAGSPCGPDSRGSRRSSCSRPAATPRRTGPPVRCDRRPERPEAFQDAPRRSVAAAGSRARPRPLKPPTAAVDKGCIAPLRKAPLTVIAHPHRGRLLAALALFAALAAIATAIGAPPAQSASTTKCKLSEKERYPRVTKPTYNLTIRVRGTSCATGKRVAKAFHACRSVTGVRCTRKVLSSWSCTGKKTSSIPTQFDGSFTCKYGSRLVTSTYQQNTP